MNESPKVNVPDREESGTKTHNTPEIFPNGNIDAIQQAAAAIEALFNDMKSRIDIQHGLKESLRTCGGYRTSEGIYVFPWGAGVHFQLDGALTHLQSIIRKMESGS